MKKVDIYVEAEPKYQRVSKKVYAFKLCCDVRGQERFLCGSGRTEGTYDKAILDAMAEGLEHMKEKAEIVLHSSNKRVLQSVEKFLGGWEQMGFVTAAGKPIANEAEWRRVSAAAAGHRMKCDYRNMVTFEKITDLIR